MRKTMFICVLALTLVLVLTGCGCSHEWYVATCTAPKTCSLCGETQGEALGHTWEDADCLTAKTCTVCKATEGAAQGHAWEDADCLNPKTCTVCEATEGEALGHDWQEATTEDPETCSLCGETQGQRLITDSRFTTASTKDLHGVWKATVHIDREVLGIEAGFEDGFDCVVFLELSKTGERYLSLDVEDAEAFMAELKAAAVQLLYDAMKQQEGLSKEETDALIKQTYGLSVYEYIDEQYKHYDVSAILATFKMEGCYYVSRNKIYTAESWDDVFSSSSFTLKDGVLTIDEMTLTGDGEPLVFTRVE